MSYPAKEPLVLDNQLKCQQLCVTLADQFASTSGNYVIVTVGEDISEVRSVLFNDDSGGLSRIAKASVGNASGVLTINLGAALAANDAVIIHYVVDES